MEIIHEGNRKTGDYAYEYAVDGTLRQETEQIQGTQTGNSITPAENGGDVIEVTDESGETIERRDYSAAGF